VIAGIGMATRVCHVLYTRGGRAQREVIRAMSIGSTVFFIGWLAYLIGALVA